MFKVTDLDKAKTLGFVEDSHTYNPTQYVYKDSFLCIDAETHIVNIVSGFDCVDGDEELMGFYKLMQAHILEEIN